MFFSSKKVVGVDIGSSSIKLAELTLSAGGATLDNFAVIPSPQQAITNGEITDSILVADSIRTAFRENGFKNKSACIGLTGTAVIIKKISIPRVDPKKLREQIQYEAAQYLPFDVSQVTIEHHVLSFTSSPENLDVLVIAAQNEYSLTISARSIKRA